MSETSALSFETLRVRREEDLLWVSLDDPGRANALSPRMIREVTEVYRRPWLEEGVRAILLLGEGKNFSAGADLEHLKSLRDAGPEDNLRDSQGLKDLFESVLRQPALTLALVQGACVAGGCGLATACDFVVAAEGARFLYSEVRIGFVAALVATFLPLRVRGSDLREMLLNPHFLTAVEAQRLGLANRVVPGERLEVEGRALALEVLTNASSQSIARTKKLLLEALGRPLGEALSLAAEINAEARSTEDCRRGIAHFLEHKRPPAWRFALLAVVAGEPVSPLPAPGLHGWWFRPGKNPRPHRVVDGDRPLGRSGARASGGGGVDSREPLAPRSPDPDAPVVPGGPGRDSLHREPGWGRGLAGQRAVGGPLPH
jgi:methylglutaconyl-CoA hydratase